MVLQKLEDCGLATKEEGSVVEIGISEPRLSPIPLGTSPATNPPLHR